MLYYNVITMKHIYNHVDIYVLKLFLRIISFFHDLNGPVFYQLHLSCFGYYKFDRCINQQFIPKANVLYQSLLIFLASSLTYKLLTALLQQF